MEFRIADTFTLAPAVKKRGHFCRTPKTNCWTVAFLLIGSTTPRK
jgi:hypothetical protein